MEQEKEVSIKELAKGTQQAIRWFAAEFKYLKLLKGEIEKVKNQEGISEELRAYRKARRFFLYVRRAERRSERKIDKVIEELKADPNLTKLADQIGIAADKLLKAFSYYAGDFQRKIAGLLWDIKKKERDVKGKKADAEELRQEENNIKKAADEIETIVKNLMEWIDALQINLKHISSEGKKLITEAEEYKPIKREGYFRTSDNVELWYQHIQRNPKIRLILLSGNGVNHTELVDIRDIFDAAGFTTFLYDPRGHGKSAKPHSIESYSLDRLAMDLKEVLGYIGIKKEPGIINIYMGQSVGGMTGAKLQAHYPIFDIFVFLTPSHDYKKTLCENQALFRLASSVAEKDLDLINQLKRYPSIAGKKSKEGMLAKGLKYIFPASRRKVEEGMLAYKTNEIANFKASVKQKEVVAMPDYLNKFYFRSGLIRRLCEKHERFNRFYYSAAVLAKRTKALWEDTVVKLGYMSLGLSRSHRIAKTFASAALFEYNIEEDLKRFSIPTLLLTGEFDIYLDPVKVGSKGNLFHGRIITKNKEILKGTYPTTFGIIGSKIKKIYVIPGATHILSFSHPYHCSYVTALFLNHYVRGLIDVGPLLKVMKLSRKHGKR